MEQLQKNIKHKEPNMSGIKNPDVKSLLKRLLNKSSSIRLSNFSELKNQNWLKNVDWKMIEEKQYRTPFSLDPYKSYIDNEFLSLTK